MKNYISTCYFSINKKIEKQLGGNLSLRSDKGMRLTEKCKMFYKYVKEVLELINNAKNEFTSFKNLTTELVNIGLGIGFVIIDLATRNYKNLKELKFNKKKLPNINICLTTTKSISLTFKSEIFIKYFKNRNRCHN